MAAGIVIKYALDAQTGTPFPTKWWDDGSGNLTQIVDGANTLPSGVAPVIGSFLGAGVSPSFAPLPGRGFNLTISGNEQGFVGQLNRSFDQGVTWLPVDQGLVNNVTKIYQEPEFGVLYQFQCVSIASGTVTYRLSQ